VFGGATETWERVKADLKAENGKIKQIRIKDEYVGLGSYYFLC
jgi:hypothetical protein